MRLQWSLLPSLFLPAQRTQKSQLVLNPVAQSQLSRSRDHSRTTVCQNRRTRLLQQVASTTSQGCQFGLALFGSTGASNCINRTPPNFYFCATIAPIFFSPPKITFNWLGWKLCKKTANCDFHERRLRLSFFDGHLVQKLVHSGSDPWSRLRFQRPQRLVWNHMVVTLKRPNWSRLVSRAVDVRRDASLLVIFLPPRVLMLISSQTLNSLKQD